MNWKRFSCLIIQKALHQLIRFHTIALELEIYQYEVDSKGDTILTPSIAVYSKLTLKFLASRPSIGPVTNANSSLLCMLHAAVSARDWQLHTNCFLGAEPVIQGHGPDERKHWSCDP